MDYIVSVPEHRLKELEDLIASIQDKPSQAIPMAVTDGNRATPMNEVANYYEQTLREQEPSYLTWAELPESVRMEFGSHLAGCIGWMFPDFTFDSNLSSELDAKFRGNIQSGDAEKLWTALLRP